jgi:hypothetical protein
MEVFMRYINRILFLGLAVALTSCASPVTSTTTSPPTTALPTSTPQPTQPAADTPTLEVPALEAGQFSFAFYHEGRGQVVLVNGGPEQGKPSSDPLELWGWNGREWSLIPTDANGPTWRNWSAIAYDTDRDVLVIHGGLQSRTERFDETWEWDGNTWTEFTGEGPGPREGSLMVYDPSRNNMILFGGAEEMDVKGDTWQWDDGTWTKVSETGPAPRFPGGMVYDPIREEVLIYSGHFAAPSGEFIDYDDLWAWDGKQWREIKLEGDTPGHRTHDAMVFDPQTNRILLFGGGTDVFRSDIWAWDGNQWAEVPTSGIPARSGHSVVYDPRRNRFVFFGGIERPAQPAMSDTWEWDRREWVCLSNCQEAKQ